MAWSKRKKEALPDAPPDPAVLRGRGARLAAEKRSRMVQLIKKQILPALNVVLRYGGHRIIGDFSVVCVVDHVYVTKQRNKSSSLWAEILLEALRGSAYKGYAVELVGIHGARGYKHDVLKTQDVEKAASDFLDKHPMGRISVKLS